MRLYTRGERLVNIHRGPTDWTFIKEVSRRHKIRRAIVRCKCGFTDIRTLHSITSGSSMRCKNCRRVNTHGGYPQEASLRQQSLNVGRNPNYFASMRSKNPKMFNAIKKAGNGRLDDGYWRLGPFRLNLLRKRKLL